MAERKKKKGKLTAADLAPCFNREVAGSDGVRVPMTFSSGR